MPNDGHGEVNPQSGSDPDSRGFDLDDSDLEAVLGGKFTNVYTMCGPGQQGQACA